MLFSFSLFVLSLAGIALLFYAKQREIVTGRGVVPEMRATLDVRAAQMKELARAAQEDLKRLPPILMHLARVAVHKSALSIARLARAAEAQAHRLADRVSYKHRFVQRAPRSEFLQKIIEHKNGVSAVEIDDDTVHNS